MRSVRDCAMQEDSRLNCCSKRTHDGLIKKLCYIEIPVGEEVTNGGSSGIKQMNSVEDDNKIG